MKTINQKKNFIWNLIGITLNSFNSFFFLIIVNRINGPEVAGMFTYGFAIACLLWVISMYYSRIYQVSNRKISDITYIKVRSVFCLLMFIISVIVSILMSSSTLGLYIILLLCLFRNIEAFADSFYGIIHKNGYLDYVGKSLFLKGLGGITLFLLADAYTKNILLSIMGLVIVNAIGTLVDYKKSKKFINDIQEDKKVSFNLILKEGFPIFAFTFLTIFLSNCQKYIMGFVVEEQFQTIFGIIIMPATVMSLCGQYLINPFLNSLTDSYEKRNYNLFNTTIRKMLIVLSVVSILGAIVAYYVGAPVLSLIYAMDLNKYDIGLGLIIIAAGFYSLSSVLSAGLTIIKQNKVQLYIYLIASLVSIIISYIFITNYGIDGAIEAYCVSIIIHFILYFIIYKYKLQKEREKTL